MLSLLPALALSREPTEPSARALVAGSLESKSTQLAKYFGEELDHQFLCDYSIESGWALDARNEEKPGEFAGCPAGQRSAGENECLAAARKAAKIAGIEVRGLKLTNEGAKGLVPGGCSYSRTSGFAIFNINLAGRTSKLYELVCVDSGEGQAKLDEDSSTKLRLQLRKAESNHPVLRRDDDLSMLVPPPNVSLLLYGTSHVRELRQIFVTAAKFGGYLQSTQSISKSKNCGGPGKASSEDKRKCGISNLPCTSPSPNFLIDTYSNGARIVMITDHRQYQIRDLDHAKELDSVLKEHGNFTGGVYIKPHRQDYFDALCARDRNGTTLDPKLVGDLVEETCDMTNSTCRRGDGLYQVIAKHVKKGLVYQADNLLKALRSEFHALGLQDEASHLCSAMCADGEPEQCELGPGTAYAARLMALMTDAGARERSDEEMEEASTEEASTQETSKEEAREEVADKQPPSDQIRGRGDGHGVCASCLGKHCRRLRHKAGADNADKDTCLDCSREHCGMPACMPKAREQFCEQAAEL